MIKEIIKLFIPLAIIWTVGYYVGYETSEHQTKKTFEKRIFNLYGEGDLGTKINYYLQTGDTLEIH